MLRARKVLGIALEDGSALMAEVRASNGRRRLIRAAECHFPEGTGYTEPLALGRHLRQSLSEHGFTARRTVFGIPARWMLSREETVPPADASTAAGILRTQAERDFSFAPEDLAMDYAGPANPGKTSTVLLVAVMRERLAQINQIARAAGLKVQAVTSSVMTLAFAAAAQPTDAPYLLYLRECYGEMVIRTEGRFRLVRHMFWGGTDFGISATRGQVDTFAGELRRAVASADMPMRAPQTGQFVVWNAAGLAPIVLSALGKDLFPNGATTGALSMLGFASQPFAEEADALRFAAAAALGLAGLRPNLLPVDFQGSPLAVRSKRGIPRRLLWPAVAAITVLAALLSLFLDWKAGQQELTETMGRLEAMGPEIEKAKSVIERTSLARSWYDTTPRVLECLRRLTQAFPEEGTIWTTSIALRAGGQGVLSGKSVEKSAVLDVVDRMNSAGGFSDVKLLFMREAAAGSREVSFTISFGFTELQ